MLPDSHGADGSCSSPCARSRSTLASDVRRATRASCARLGLQSRARRSAESPSTYARLVMRARLIRWTKELRGAARPDRRARGGLLRVAARAPGLRASTPTSCRARVRRPLPERPTDATRWSPSSRPPPTRASSPAPAAATSGSSSAASVPALARRRLAHVRWDQNAGLHVDEPAAAIAEEVAGGWLVELLGLPPRRLVRIRDRGADGELHRRSPPRATTCSRTRAGTSSATG